MKGWFLMTVISARVKSTGPKEGHLRMHTVRDGNRIAGYFF
jgi:hypothetical protein